MNTEIQNTKAAIDELMPHLVGMDRQDKLDQWISYLLESIESDIGAGALDQTLHILQERFDHGRW